MNFLTEAFDAIYQGEADQAERIAFDEAVTPLLQKHYPLEAASSATNNLPSALQTQALTMLAAQVAALTQMAQNHATASPAKSGKSRAGQLSINVIWLKEVQDFTDFKSRAHHRDEPAPEGVEPIPVEPILRKSGKKMGERIPIGWTHFVSHYSLQWKQLLKNDDPLVLALKQRQDAYKTHCAQHGATKYEAFKADAVPFNPIPVPV